jgi:hypothetical protein
LNGCSTQQQTQGLLDASVSAVISTSRAIDDRALCAGLPTPHTAPTEGLPESPRRVPFRETYGQQFRRGSGIRNGLAANGVERRFRRKRLPCGR